MDLNSSCIDNSISVRLKVLAMEKGLEKPRSTQVIIAALNEEKGIGLTIAELKEHLIEPEILVIDGKSFDRTVEIAKNNGATILCQDGNGKGDAIAKGISWLNSNSDYVVITDADYTYPAEYIPEMINVMTENSNIGMVCGNRFSGEIDAAVLSSVFSFGNKLIALTHNLFNGVKLQDPLTGLRVVRGDLMRNWQAKSKGFDIEVELNHYIERCGFNIVEIPIHYRKRLGQKKLKVSDGASILKRIMIESTY